MRGNRKVIVGAAATIALFFALFSSPGAPRTAAARSRYKSYRIDVATGLTLTRMIDRHGPNRIRILSLDPASALTLDVALANDKIPGHETTSSMAARNGAVAAINGDYTMLPTSAEAGRPVDLFAEDGDLVASPLIWGRNFALSHDESRSFIGHPHYKVVLRQQDGGGEWNVPAWNDKRLKAGEFGAYTPLGGKTFSPPNRACSARLLPMQTRTWEDSDMGVEDSYLVDVVKCRRNRMPRQGGLVIATRRGTKQARHLKNQLIPDEIVSVGWTTGWPGVLDTIGGNPSLLEDGRYTVGKCEISYFCRRNPRTGIGYKADGTLLMVTVDGRRKRSVGMTPMQFARLFRHLGAVSALNLDGGGSTSMWVKGKLVNVPSSGYERPVGSSILVLPGADPGETAPLPHPTPTPTPSPSMSPSILPSPSISLPPPPSVSPRTGIAPAGVPYVRTESPCRSLHDAASTGGFLDALATGAFGRTGRLAPELRRALGVYRGTRSCASLIGNARR